jgi:RNA polymerase sigma factor (sigma-70 family)
MQHRVMPAAAPVPPSHADEELLDRFRAGDEAAFTAIIERHRRAVEAQLRLTLRGRDPFLVDDLAQDVFLRAYLALRRDDRPVALRAWLRRVAVNRAVDELRRRQPEPLGETEAEDSRALLGRDAACTALERLELRAVLDALSALPPRQRRALAGRAVQSLPYAEIAKDAGTTPRAVKALVHRARQNVRETLAHAA